MNKRDFNNNGNGNESDDDYRPPIAGKIKNLNPSSKSKNIFQEFRFGNYVEQKHSILLGIFSKMRIFAE